MKKKQRAPLIYQRHPVFSIPSQFRPKGWTDSISSYIREAKKLRALILANGRLMDRSYTWHVTINIEAIQSPKESRALWTKVCGKLRRRGIVALWVREPTRSGKLHYHLILKNIIRKADLENAIKGSMPPKLEIGWHKRIQRIVGDEWQLVNYVTKAQLKGWRDGKLVADYYARKRLLFKPNLGLAKSNHIGPFWEKSKTVIWKSIIEKEKQIADGLDQPGVRKLINHIYEMLDKTVSKKRIERSFGSRADFPGVKEWAVELLAGGDDAYQSYTARSGGK